MGDGPAGCDGSSLLYIMSRAQGFSDTVVSAAHPLLNPRRSRAPHGTQSYRLSRR